MSIFVSSDDITANQGFARDGGPSTDPGAEELVDIAPQVGLLQPENEFAYGGKAMVTLGTGVWMRTRTGWGMPGELQDITQPLGMTATRARQLAALLLDAASQADKANDSAPAIPGGDR